VTGREQARVMTSGVSRLTDVEPLSNYTAARVLREFDRGGIGLLATSVRRRLDTPALQTAHVRRAEVIGGDGYYFFDRDKDWVVTGKLSASRVAGSAGAILDLQRAPQRYYQRPDAPHVSLDPSRTSLTGYAGRLNLNRNAGMWRANASIWGVSPGFESNDVGFQPTGDRGGGHGVLLWVNPTPNRVTRQHHAWVARAFGWSFNRERTTDMWYGCSDATFLNYWSLGGCLGRFGRVLDDRLTRGGPAVTGPAARSVSLNGGSDQRKWLSVSLSAGRDWNEAGSDAFNGSAILNLKPSSSLTLSTGPGVTRSTDVAQYVRTESDGTAVETFGERYVFATIDQIQVSLVTRLSYVISPRASLQVFMQPLLATGDYTGFKELSRPGTFDFHAFGGGRSSIAYDGLSRVYTVTPDESAPAVRFAFDDPNFNFKSLRVNAVFRWEFRPGSTLYAVWTEQREDAAHPGEFRLGRDARALLRAPADDIVLVKIAYWLGR
jgi:hypothetical protein